jgi:2-aminophenol/2-amino-5-chlorophenol 1,6-dioxygenase alpha subunit
VRRNEVPPKRIRRTPDAPAQKSREPASGIVASFIVPHLPHPYLIPDANPGYRRIRDAYEAVRKRIAELKPDILLLYSTRWPSVIGHQVQTHPAPEWTHVDEEWHELGAIPYKLRMDKAFGEAYVKAGQARGLEMRAVAYDGFPVDTGSIVALKLLDPKNRVPASIVSCNMYADRAETIVLGKAARDAVLAQGKRAVAIGVTALSNRLFSGVVPFAEDRIHSRKDDEWNRKYLEFLGRGRLEDASQLAREFASQANGDSKMKAIWWLAAVSGASNNYAGTVHAYEPIYGTGAAVVELVPGARDAADKEYDEADPETHHGDRNVLGGANAFESAEAVGDGDPDAPERWSGAHSSADEDAGAGYPGAPSSPPEPPMAPIPPTRNASQTKSASSAQSAVSSAIVHAKTAPKPVGAYAHARRVGDLLFLAGIGPRTPGTDAIPGGPTRDKDGKPAKYDVRAQTRQVIKNVEAVLKESGASLKDVFDVQVFLTNMKDDFKAFNEVYGEAFKDIQATRTTMEVGALPTAIAVEFKVVAQIPRGK